MGKIIFKEKQHFNQWWLYLLFIVLFAYFGFLFFESFSLDLKNKYSLVISAVILILLLLFILKVNLKTLINEQGVYVSFWPLQIKYKHYSWEEIKKIEVIRYSPIKDFGGWGYRISLRGRGVAYNIRGNKGIKIFLENGKEVLIGTQKVNEAQETITQYIKTSETNA